MTRALWFAAILPTLVAAGYAAHLSLRSDDRGRVSVDRSDDGRRTVAGTAAAGPDGAVRIAIPRPARSAEQPADEAPDEPIDAVEEPPLDAKAEAVVREATLSRQFTAELEDPAWSRETERAIADAVNSEALAGTRVRSAACRSTMCRVEVEVDDDIEAIERFETNLPRTAPFATNGVIHRVEGEGSPHHIVYFARPGHVI